MDALGTAQREDVGTLLFSLAVGKYGPSKKEQ